MKTKQIIIRARLMIALLSCAFVPLAAGAADGDARTPAVIQSGFKSWAAKDVSYAFDVWKKGGLLETDAKPAKLVRYFGRMSHSLGNYKSYEVLDAKQLGQSCQIVYVSINFDQAAVYARFMVYRTDKDWVVQNMDFSARPETIMPWLAFTGEDYGQ